ncbi:MAG: hypothetical protein ACLFU8_17190 [Anaerolineales bacterium]
MSRCKDLQGLLALRAGDRTAGEQARVAAHLATCPACAARARTYARQDQLLRDGPTNRLDGPRRAALEARIDRERRRHMLRSRLSPLLGSAAALLLMLALALGARLLLPGSIPPTPEEERPAVTDPSPALLEEPLVRNTLEAYLTEALGISGFGGQVFCTYEPLHVAPGRGSNLHAYVWAYCAEYYLAQEALTMGSATSLPVALELRAVSPGYEVVAHRAPRDGALYAEDLQAIFPPEAQTAMCHEDPTCYNARSDRLAAAVEARAREQLLAEEAPPGPFPETWRALAAYEPPADPTGVTAALIEEVEAWLAAGNDPGELAALLRTLPKLEQIEVEVQEPDLDGDGREDIVITTELLGLPVVAFITEETGGVRGHVLPADFGEPLPSWVEELRPEDLTGEGAPETLLSYYVQGGSGWTTLLYVYRWETGAPELIFHAELRTWAGPATWSLAPDPATGGAEIVLTYPHLYGAFDHKLTEHPLGRQVWRWDEGAGRYVQAEESVDLEQNGWEPETEMPTTGRLKALVNEGEEAFRAGEYPAAQEHFAGVLALASAEGWEPGIVDADWVGVARLRRAQLLALLDPGRSQEAVAEMEALAETYAGDPLGDLAAAFLAGYEGEDAAARAIAAMQAVNLHAHLYHERGGALTLPVDAGLLYPAAGIIAYLDAHPELTSDPEALQGGLEAVGYDVVRVEVDDGVTLILELPDEEPTQGQGWRWRFAPSDSGWYVLPQIPRQGTWPVVGGFAGPRYDGERVGLYALPEPAVSLPYTLCEASQSWVRPSETEQAEEVWSIPRYEGHEREILRWIFYQDFYRYHGGGSEMFDAWPTSGLWTSEAEYTCGTPSSRRPPQETLELWLLLHNVVGVEHRGKVYTITVEPVERGYQIIHVPVSGPESEEQLGPEVEIRFVDRSGREIDRLPKAGPWNVAPRSREVVTVQGTVVDNNPDAQLLTVVDEGGVAWSVPWMRETLLEGVEAFEELRPGATVEVAGVERTAATPHTLSAIRLTLLAPSEVSTPQVIPYPAAGLV